MAARAGAKRATRRLATAQGLPLGRRKVGDTRSAQSGDTTACAGARRMARAAKTGNTAAWAGARLRLGRLKVGDTTACAGARPMAHAAKSGVTRRLVSAQGFGSRGGTTASASPGRMACATKSGYYGGLRQRKVGDMNQLHRR